MRGQSEGQQSGGLGSTGTSAKIREWQQLILECWGAEGFLCAPVQPLLSGGRKVCQLPRNPGISAVVLEDLAGQSIQNDPH